MAHEEFKQTLKEAINETLDGRNRIDSETHHAHHQFIASLIRTLSHLVWTARLIKWIGAPGGTIWMFYELTNWLRSQA